MLVAMKRLRPVGFPLSSSLRFIAASFSFVAITLAGVAQSSWTGRDIGAASPAGSSSAVSGTHTVRGAGADIWDSADAFQFFSGGASGDVSLVARVPTLTNTNGWAKAGLMFRDGLAANARNVMILRTPNGTISFQYRAATGGVSQFATGSYGLSPAWLMLSRAGNVFTGYESSDGNTWRKVGSIEIAMPTTIETGLAVTSHNNGTLAAATFDNLDVVGSSTSGGTTGGTGTPPPSTDPLRPNAPSNLVCAGATSNSMKLTWTDNAGDETGYVIERNTSHGYIAVANLPADATTWTDSGSINPDGNPEGSGLRSGTTYFYSLRCLRGTQESLSVAASGTTLASASTTAWTSADVGAVGVAGSMSQSGTTFTVRGSGADIWGNADAFQFVHQKLRYNGEVIARVASLTNTNGWAKAGVMIRGDLTSGAAYALMALTPTSGASFQFRTTAGTQSQMSGQDWGVGAPQWVRLVRAGNTITAYTSNDRTNWKSQGSATLTLPDEVYVGLAVTAHNNATLNTAVFEQLSVLAATGQ
jgi:regulation of enolase protein 1 (concanavalin A-like superfamily)